MQKTQRKEVNMSKNELIGPETNLYGQPERVGMKSLADARTKPVEVMPAVQELTELPENVAVELDYGGDFDGQMFTFKPLCG